MTYKESLIAAMDMLAADPKTVFVGYGLKTGRAMGTLKNVPDEKLIEFPVAEGLMMSAAIGMSLKGLRPVVYFERMDFMMNAMDALVNHLSAIAKLSHDEFRPAVIIRATVGNREKPLFTGPVHTQNFCQALYALDINVRTAYLGSCLEVYQRAQICAELGESTVITEYKDWL